MFTIQIMASTYAGFLAATGMLPMVYIICLIVGGGLLVISTFLGGDSDVGGDADVEMDFDADADVDVEGDAHVEGAGVAAAGGLSLANWFSMRFVVYFIAAFGLIGTALSFTSAMVATPVLIWSVAGGLVMGQAAHQTMRLLKRSSGDGTTAASDFVDKLGRVTLAIEPPQRGEVALQVRGRERFVPAKARRSDDRFEVGADVMIVAFNNGTAEVVSKKEYEFINDAKSGGL